MSCQSYVIICFKTCHVKYFNKKGDARPLQRRYWHSQGFILLSLSGCLLILPWRLLLTGGAIGIFCSWFFLQQLLIWSTSLYVYFLSATVSFSLSLPLCFQPDQKYPWLVKWKILLQILMSILLHHSDNKGAKQSV